MAARAFQLNPISKSARSLFWVLFFALILAAWVGLYIQALGSSGGPLWGAFDSGFAASAHAYVSPWVVLNMWLLMILAMMLPTLIPMLATLIDLTWQRPGALWHRCLFLGGYVLVWAVFACLAAILQLGLRGLGALDAAGIILRPGLTVLVLLVAGLYQFSALKQACLRACQAPMLFFLSNWRDGRVGALAMGLHHGLFCLGCCWALMLLGFVGGVMNLFWMGLATLLMSLEKLPSIGKHVSPLMGSVLLALALAYLVHLIMA